MYLPILADPQKSIIMKKFLLLALAALTLSFVACDKKDKQKEEPTPQENPIVGTWVYEDGEEGDFHFKHAITIGEKNDFEYTLKALYSEESVHFGYTWNGNYELNGDTVTIHFKKMTWYFNWDEENFEPHTEKFVYTINGNTMTLNWLDDGGYDRPTELKKQ